jgi:hypothetical protein
LFSPHCPALPTALALPPSFFVQKAHLLLAELFRRQYNDGFASAGMDLRVQDKKKQKQGSFAGVDVVE